MSAAATKVRRVSVLFAVALAVLAVGTGCQPSPPATTRSAGDDQQPKGDPKMTKLSVRSPAFDAGKPIPKKHTGEGEDVSPALTWSGAPAETKEFALIMDDPDAPGKEPWVHWVIYNIPSGAAGLKEGVAKTDTPSEPAGAHQGTNSWPKMGYNGPMPPPGHGVHHYHFKAYALDTALAVKPGLSKAELLAAMKGHILAEGELVGTYERKK